jgi:hypothetical protein
VSVCRDGSVDIVRYMVAVLATGCISCKPRSAEQAREYTSITMMFSYTTVGLYSSLPHYRTTVVYYTADSQDNEVFLSCAQ